MDENLQITQITQLLEIGESARARELCQTLYDEGSTHPFVLSYLAYQHLESEAYEAALALSQKAVDQTPDNVSLLRNLGIAQQKSGMLKQAIESFSSAINLGSADATFYLHLGSALHDRDSHYWACVAYQKAFLLDTSLLDIHAGQHSDMTRRLIRPARRQLQDHLLSQFDHINSGVEKRQQGSVSPRVHSVQQQLTDNLDLLTELAENTDTNRLSSLDMTVSLDWPETFTRRSFDWMIRLESVFPLIYADSVALLKADRRHHWLSRSSSTSGRYDMLHLMRAGERNAVCLPHAAATLTAIEQLQFGRLHMVSPNISLQRVSPGESAVFTEQPNHFVFHHFMPLVWADDCVVTHDGVKQEQQVGRVICFEQGEYRISNQSGSDYVQLQLTTLHPTVLDEERAVMHSSLQDIHNWLSLCTAFKPSDLST